MHDYLLHLKHEYGRNNTFINFCFFDCTKHIYPKEGGGAAQKSEKPALKSLTLIMRSQSPKRRPPIIFEPKNPEIDILEELLGKKEEIVPPAAPKPIPVRSVKSNALKNIELTEKRMADIMKRNMNRIRKISGRE